MMKRILPLILLLSLLLTSCGGLTFTEVEEPSSFILTDSGYIVDTTARAVPEQVTADLRNVFYTLYNNDIPMLCVKLPTKASSYGYAAWDDAALDAFLQAEFIDTLDLTALLTDDPDAYFYPAAEGFNADGARRVQKEITALLPEYYSMLVDGAPNDRDSYYTRETIAGGAPCGVTADEEGVSRYYGEELPFAAAETAADAVRYVPAKDHEYKVRVTGGSVSRNSAVVSFDELPLDAEAASISISNLSNEGLVNDSNPDTGVNILVLHDLDDLSILPMLADACSHLTAVDVRNVKGETVCSVLKDYTDYDLCVTLLDFAGEWPAMNKGKDVVCRYYADGTDHSHVAVKDNNRILQVIYPKWDYIDLYVDNVAVFRDDCAALGTEVLFCMAAYKDFPGITELPAGFVDYAQTNADEFLAGIGARDVPYIDFRTSILEDIPATEVFYRTDHHWKAESGFWAAGKIVDYMKDSLGWTDLDPDGTLMSADSYDFKTREHDFLAHFGNAYAHSIVGADDFTLILPKFDTKFKMVIDRNGRNETTRGDFYDALITSYYLKGNNPRSYNRYAAYLNGDQPLIHITNDTEGIYRSDRKVLVVKDSFGNCVNPYLAMNFDTFDIIDIRHYKMMTLTQFVTKNHYDLVIFIYNPNLLTEQPGMYIYK